MKLVGLDLEGPVFRPGLDMARLTVERLWDRGLRELRGALVRFDAWDDRWYLRERRGRGLRHSTGTTPLVASLGASGSGATVDHFLRVARRMERNPGALSLVRGLAEGRTLVLLTSGAPALGLSLAREAGLPFSRTFTHGLPPARGRAPLRAEAARRWPRALEDSALKEFVRDYLALVPPLSAPAGGARFRESASALARSLPPGPRAWVARLLLSEGGVMGGHGKLRALCRFGRPDVAIGDSIVDAEMVGGAKWGIALNCTSPPTLAAARWHAATTEVERLPEVVDALERGRDPRELRGPDLRLFDAKEYRRGPRKVLAIHRKFKRMLTV
ncbi:MAG: hypothetical protein QXT68_09435 [Halobacteria archaeon]